MPRLIGENIILREYKQEDLIEMNEWKKDRELTNNLSDIFLRPHTLKNTEEFLSFVLTNKTNDIYYVIADKNTENYIGQIDINIDWINRIGNLGIVIGRSEYRNNGIGASAIMLLLDYAFKRMNLNKIQLDVHADNERAIKCYKKCGFIIEGTLRDKIFRDGKYVNVHIMGILKKEYEEKWPS